MKQILLLISLCFTFILSAQTPDKTQLENLTELEFDNSIELLKKWLSLPNNGAIEEHVDNNINYAKAAFEDRGFQTQVLETAATPLLLAERYINSDLPTLLIYAHADGQPVDPTQWNQPNPYEPVLKEKNESGDWTIIPWSALDKEVNPDWRIYARSASDDKGPIAMLWKALDIMENAELNPTANLKVVLDFEEELGSPNLPDAVNVYKNELAADMLIILDGPQHATNQPTLSFGARGIQTFTLKTFGAKGAQHSGHYGNYITNPARQLSQILASFYTDDGRVSIPGYYDGVVISDQEMEALKAVPDDEEQLKKDLGFITQDSVASFLKASIQYPSLNIRGMRSGWVEDEVRTIVPNMAIAEFDIRLVKSSQPQKLIDLIKSYVEDQGYTVIDEAPTDEQRQRLDKVVQMNFTFSYDAFKTDIDSPVGDWLTEALERAFESKPIIIPGSGGSIPISPFVAALDIPAVTVPLVNNDNNQHSPDENLRLGHYKDGIISVLAILTEKFSK
jgi:acetylornithine deacetylase/succinyl-diaminopimelate desuccinylase-like protein